MPNLTRMRFLFTTIQGLESEFYGRVGRELQRRGHEVAHVVYSRRSAQELRASGNRAWCVADELAALAPFDPEAEGRRIAERYETPTLRDVYKTDPPCYGKPEAWCVDRTARHFLALERIFDEYRPEVVVPEVGSETMRTAAHLIALDRGIEVLFLFYTIFPRPLRLYRNRMHAPIVPPEELRELTPGERREVDEFVVAFKERARPIRAHRRPRVTAKTLRDFASHVRTARSLEPDSEYLKPGRFVRNYFKERARALLARRWYQLLSDERPFVYFPLHVVDDYKIKRVIPHTYDQASLIEQVADALPHGWDILLKEHPMSVGRNRLSLLRRIPNARLVSPWVNSHELMQRAEAVVVISSTVGLEALMYGKPVLTMGQPFYAGYGVTLDLDSFREIREKVPELLTFRPDPERIHRFFGAAMRACYAGKPVNVDSSDENAVQLAESLDAAVMQAREPDLARA